MKVVFLDIDGVLNQGFGDAHPSMVRNLNRVTRRAGACIVVHSSWRYLHRLEGLKTILKGWGVKGEVLDTTPIPEGAQVKFSGVILISNEAYSAFTQALPEEFRQREDKWNFERAASIQNWLNASGQDVSGFVILDDHKEFGHLAPHHIKTKMNVGLTQEQAEHAIRLLRA